VRSSANLQVHREQFINQLHPEVTVSNEFRNSAIKSNIFFKNQCHLVGKRMPFVRIPRVKTGSQVLTSLAVDSSNSSRSGSYDMTGQQWPSRGETDRPVSSQCRQKSGFHG